MTQSNLKPSTSKNISNSGWAARTGRFLDRISFLGNRAGKWVSVIALIGMMSVVTVDVILRSSIGKPILGAYELVQLLMVVLIFFALPYTALKDGHVTVDLVYDRFSSRGRAIIDSISNFLSFGIFVLICWQSVVQGMSLLESKQVTLALKIPVYGFLFIVALGCALLCLVLLARLFQSLGKWK